MIRIECCVIKAPEKDNHFSERNKFTRAMTLVTFEMKGSQIKRMMDGHLGVPKWIARADHTYDYDEQEMFYSCIEKALGTVVDVAKYQEVKPGLYIVYRALSGTIRLGKIPESLPIEIFTPEILEYVQNNKIEIRDFFKILML